MTFRRLLVAVAILLLGSVTAVAVADTTSTGTVVACATATAPTHTVAVDGTNVSTVGGDTASKCATTTYTVPTVTDTVTVTDPTTTTTATASPTFASETAYTQTRPAFTPTRTVDVSSAAGLRSAITNLQPGDLVQASAPFTVTSGSSGSALTISNKLSAPAEIDLTGVSLVYSGTSQGESVWINNPSNLRIFGGDLSMTNATTAGGACIVWYGGQHVLWWGFNAHDCGSSGIGVANASTNAYPVQYDDIEGTIHHFSLNGGLYDNHQEKCTGIHGANLSDTNTAAFDHNRFAFNVYDSPCTGGGIEFGTSKASPIPDSNTIILQCDSLTFVSTIQTGGNCYQTWGYGETNTDIKYLVASNIEGHPYWAGGLYNKPNSYLATDTVEYGRATNVNQNPRYASDPNWDTTGNTVFQDVEPTP